MIYTLIKKDAKDNIEKIFSFDSVSSFSEQWSGSVSKSPVESGFIVSDHVSIENPVFDLTVTLSSYSLFNDSLEIYWDGEDFVTDNEDGDRGDAHLVAKNNLVKMFLDRDALILLESDTNSFNYDNLKLRYEQLTSGFVKEYSNCFITSLGFESNENVQSSAAFVKIKIEQLNVAYVQTTTLTEQEMQKEIVGRVAKNSVNAGAADTSTVTDETGKPNPTSVAEKKGDVTTVKNNMPLEYRVVETEAVLRNKVAHLATAISENEYEMGRVTNLGGAYRVDRKVITP